MAETSYQSHYQINGKAAHEPIDNKQYTKSKTLKSLEVYSEEYQLVGKIDIYEVDTHTLIERKKKVNQIFDGYVFQLYAQCLSMREMGYRVDKLKIHSLDDNKTYPIKLPEEDAEMMHKFQYLLNDIKNFSMETYQQTNALKCNRCIYSPYCDRSLKNDE